MPTIHAAARDNNALIEYFSVPRRRRPAKAWAIQHGARVVPVERGRHGWEAELEPGTTAIWATLAECRAEGFALFRRHVEG